MKLKITGLLLLSLLFAACGEFNNVLKNPDLDVKFEYAKKYFDQGKYGRTATLMEEYVQSRPHSSKGEEALYLLARSYYEMKDYSTAAEYFKMYYTRFRAGEYTELARFYSAYCLFLDSPDPRLDQTTTYNAISQFLDFIEMYPQSEMRKKAEDSMFELQEKLALKELMAAQLYYKLGDYVVMISFPGANYSSCIITSQNALRSYPNSKFREEFMNLIFKSKYEMAMSSVEEKKDIRFRDVVDEYHNYANEYPEGKYIKDIKKMYDKVEKELNN
ncbi:MAG: outer membrane protein assembly factor BamD [Dysgonamonadaceae bacterium]|jgi:outer membrane protein assembly factor BamD|nr:outer membrane protein assembly factor BamD [Dysgonamonadaceae bacterium]